MNFLATSHWLAKALSSILLCAAALFMWGCNGDDDSDSSASASTSDGLVVSKATCGPNDNPEKDLQGQVSAASRAAGFKGNNCNLQLIGQTKGDGGSWQFAWFQDKAGHLCGYYDTAATTINRTHLGVVTVDASNPAAPVPTAWLETTSMIDPWESLKVNDRRQLLAGVSATNGNGGPEIDIYDISGDCRKPQLLTSSPVGLDDGTGQFVAAVRGHEGNFTPDGLTFYGGNLGAGYIYPIDVTNTTKPRMLTQYFTAPGRVHGMMFSDDGNRGYLAIAGTGGAATTRPPGTPDNNGLLILDTSEVQARRANPTIRVVGVNVWGDGSGAQHTILIKVNGKPYVIQVDEAGSGGNSQAGWDSSCAAGLPAWNMARIIDITDETKPVVISKTQLEYNDPKNCKKVVPDLAGLTSFSYGTHYCSVDNRLNATTMACGEFNSGIRVYDIRDPAKLKEIAYYNPPSLTVGSPGSNHFVRSWVAGGPDWCSAQIRMDVATGTLMTHCQDQGFVALRFTNGAWPFPTSTTPPGLQN